MENPNISIHRTKNKGNCFYEAVAYTLYDSIGDSCIKHLRKIVAENVTSDLFKIYIKRSKKTPNYRFMNGIYHLDSLKDEIMRSKLTNQNTDVIWADKFAISSIADELNITFLIYQEALKKTFIVEADENKTPEHLKDLKAYIVLILYDTRHYNLIMYKNRSIFCDETLPQVIKDLFFSSYFSSFVLPTVKYLGLL